MPQESEDFEAYRVLGECAAQSLFREEIVGNLALDRLGMEGWFQAMADNLLPDNDEAFA